MRDTTRSDTRTGAVVLATIVLILGGAWYYLGNSNTPTTTATEAESDTSVGQTAYIASAGTRVEIEYQKGYVPDVGTVPCTVTLPNWVAVKVMEDKVAQAGWTVPVSKVLVLEGPFTGMSGYLRSDWVHAQRPRMPDMASIVRRDHTPAHPSPLRDDPCPIGWDERR